MVAAVKHTRFDSRQRVADCAGLSAQQLAEFEAAGVIVLEEFRRARATAGDLRERALELVDAFDPSSVRSVFSAMEQTQLGDKYFEESGDKIRFFFEQDAFDDAGNLRQSKGDSLNKIGHAMHDLDPVFDDFSRTPQMAAVVESLGYHGPGHPAVHVYLQAAAHWR